MTGLDLANDTILQIACYITDYDLNVLEPEGFEVVIHHDKEALDKMDEWCTKHHAATGLTQKAIDSDITHEQAAERLFDYIKKYVPERKKALLAGNTVHADKAFLIKEPYRVVIKHLHHRILDVSAIKEAARRWAAPEVLKKSPQKKGLHEARQDILESIEEAKYYRNVFFQPNPPTIIDPMTVGPSAKGNNAPLDAIPFQPS